MPTQRKLARGLLLLGGLLLFSGLPAVYLLNASHTWRAGGLIPVDHWRLLPASAYPEGTLRAIGSTTMLAAVLWAAAALPSRVRRVLIPLILMGTAGIALLTLNHRLVPRSAYAWTWLFVSRNQFAAFACLIFPVALTGGARAQYKAFQDGRLSSPSGLYYLAAGLLAAAIMQTGSRGGIAVMLLQTAGFTLILLRIWHCYPFAMPPLSIAQRAFFGILLALALGLGTAALLRNQPVPRTAEGDVEFRSVVRSDTLAMWRSRPWWGAGPGTFSTVFPYYQTLPVEQYYFKHAHCDPLQFLAEFGILGGGLTLLGAGLILRGASRKPRGCQKVPAFKELEGYGLLLAIGGVALHSLVDFPFRHPLILLVASAWIGLVARAYLTMEQTKSPSRP